MELSAFTPAEDEIAALIEQAFDNGFEAAKGRKPKSAEERKQWIVKENGAEALKGVAPIAFAVEPVDGADFTQADTYLEGAVQVSPVVNPLFHALMVKLGATPNGPRSYEVSAGKGKSATELAGNVKRLTAILDVIPGAICYAPAQVDQGEGKGFESWNTSRLQVFRDLYCLIHDTSAGQELSRKRLNPMTEDHPSEGALAGAAVVISASKGRIYIKVCTNRVAGKGLLLSGEAGTPDLDRFRPGGRLDPQITTPDRAATLMAEAEAQGYTVLDPSGTLTAIRSRIAKMVVAQRVPGSPGQGRLIVGSEVGKVGAEDRLTVRGPVSVGIVPADTAGKAVAKAQKAGAQAALAPEVADVIAMASAQPIAEDDPDSPITLRDYQREAVGLHVATSIGYLQACSVGLGKTAITLRGMREAAKAAK